MKTYIYKAFLLLLSLSLLLSVVACSSNESTPEEETLGIEQLNTGIAFTPQSYLDGWDVVAENDQYQLLLDQNTATVAVYVKSTGYIWKSNLSEDEVAEVENDDVKEDYLSQLLISYYDGWKKEWIIQ